MKRCPECGREYDLSMSFCLDDGTELLYGPASMDEPATAVLSESSVSAGGQFSESATRPQIHTTAAEREPQRSLGDGAERHRAAKTQERTGDLPRGVESLDRKWLVAAAAALLLVIAGIAFALYKVVWQDR